MRYIKKKSIPSFSSILSSITRHTERRRINTSLLDDNPSTPNQPLSLACLKFGQILISDPHFESSFSKNIRESINRSQPQPSASTTHDE